MSAPRYCASPSVLTITSAPSSTAACSPARKATPRPPWRRQHDDVVGAVLAGDRDGTVARPVVDDEPLDRGEAGHAAREVGERAGQRRLLVQARDLDDQPHHANRAAGYALGWSPSPPARSCCACGGSARGCRGPTTSTRPRISSPRAVGHGWDPGYLANPPAYTHLLHLISLVGPDGFLTGRVVAALLGTAAAVLVALAGARLAGVAAGLAAGHCRRRRLPAGLLQPPGAQRRAGDGRGRARAVGGRPRARRIRPSPTTRSPAPPSGWPRRRSTRRGIALLAVADRLALPERLLVAAAAALARLPRRLPQRADRRPPLPRRGHEPVGLHGPPQARADRDQRVPLLPAGADLGAGLGAARRRAGRRGRARPRGPARAALLVLPPLLFLLYMGHHERFFGRWLLPAVPFLACSPAPRWRGCRAGSCRSASRRSPPRAWSSA